MLLTESPAACLIENVWQTVNVRFYRPDALDHWSKWRTVPRTVSSLSDAVSYCRQMLSSLHDSYTRLLDPQDFGAKKERRESSCSTLVCHKTESGIAYLRCPRFNQLTTADQMEEHLQRLQSCSRLIIDLRDNVGGLIQQAVSCCQFFLPEGVIASLEDRIGGALQRRTFAVAAATALTIQHGATEDDDLIDGVKRRPCLFPSQRLLLVINANTASAAELFAAALTENDRAVAVGTRSCGKGIGQDVVKVLDAPELYLKVSCIRYFTPDGNWLGDGQTIDPAGGINPTPLPEEWNDAPAEWIR